jgi:polysaccharide pyruvyl transferase WcaK-like protein
MIMKNRRLLLVGAFGTGNVGDDAILCGLLNRIKKDKKIKTSNILVFARDPKRIKSLCNVQSKRKNFGDLVRTDTFVIGGGELFSDVNKMALKYSTLGLLAKLLGKKVIFNAIGIQEVGRLSKFLMWLAFNLADEISVRNLESQDHLLNLHVAKKIDLVKDSAFYMEPISHEAAQILLEENGITFNEKRFIIGLTSQHIFDRNLRKKAYTFLLNLLKRVLEKHKQVYVVFVPFCDHVDSKIQKDLLFGDWLQKKLDSKRFKVIRAEHSPMEIMGMIGSFDVLISTRLHPLIFAVKMNIPAIGLGVYKKTNLFCTSQNLKILEIDDPEESYNLLKRVIAQKTKENRIPNNRRDKL